MQVTLESLAGLERRLRVEIPEDRVTGEVDKRLTTMTQTVRVPGFRPGKVPLKVVARRFGRQVRDEVVGEIIRTSFVDAITQEKLRPAGAPSIAALPTESGGGVAYTAVFDVFPEVQLPQLDALEIKRPMAAVTGEDVDRMLETLRVQRRSWTQVARAARATDRVVVDYEGTTDGTPIEGGQAKEVPIELDAGRMIPGFEDGLIGLQAEAEKTLELEFPENYPSAEVAGKAATFAVKVHRVEEPVLPDLDEAFAKGFGISEGGVEALRNEVRSNMERELADTLRGLLKQRVMSALVEGQNIALPQALVREEAERAISQRRVELAQAGVDPKRVDLRPEMFEEVARSRVTLGLVLAEVVKLSELSPDVARVRGRVDSIASTYEEPDEVRRWYYAEPSRLREIESAVLEDQVVDWLLERAQVTDDPSSFDELMKPGQTRPVSTE